MEGQWAYVSPGADRRTFGLSGARLAGLLRESDALVNLTGSTLLRDEHMTVPVRIYLETDPVLRQIEIAQGKQSTMDMLSAHTHHFTYGENFGQQDCGVPVAGFQYRPTRPPVVMDWWRNGDQFAPATYTTIASWKQSGKDIEWKGETYTWSKHHEFLKYLDLPASLKYPCELALACGEPDANEVMQETRALLASHGWRAIDALQLSRDLCPYRDYIVRSRAEFTVAKDQNIRLRSGWFSDRSACYLAASRPVVTQDTGFGKALPVGEGLFDFRTMDDVVAAFEEIESDYSRHARAARQIADGYLRAESVLESLLSEAGL
jgi:hypothetical protein